MLNDKERAMAAVTFAAAYVRSGRSYPSHRELVQLALDFVDKIEEELLQRYSITAHGATVSNGNKRRLPT